MVDRHVLDPYAVAHHGSHADKGAYFDHVRQQCVCGAMQSVDSLDSEKVGGDAADVRSHGIEHLTELLNIRLTGGVVDGGDTFREHGSHDDVGSAGDGSLVEEHVASFEVVGLDLKHVAPLDALEVGTEMMESQEVCVEASASYLVTTRLSHYGPVVSCEERSEHEHASSQRRAFFDKLIAFKIIQV